MDEVFGAVVDEQTRCVHWNSALDVVAIRFACCGRFYPCYECHDEDVSHVRTVWPSSAGGQDAVLCGVCRTRLTIAAYLAAADACLSCDAAFNPGCRLHHDRYFAAP